MSSLLQELHPRPPLVIAHRGGAGLRPENTIAAFIHALEIGADGFELDVHLSADGIVMVHHDAQIRADMSRDESGRWLELAGPEIRKATARELKSYDIGRISPSSPYAGLFPHQIAVDGERMPTLAEVLQLLKRRSEDAIAFIEIKAKFSNEPFREVQLVQEVLKTVAASGLGERVRIMSFDWRALDMVSEGEKSILLGHATVPGLWLAGEAPPEHELLPQKTREHIATLVRAGPEFMRNYSAQCWSTEFVDYIASRRNAYWTPNHHDVTPCLMAHATRCGVDVFPWTVDEPTAICRMHAMNVAGIITDYPNRALQFRRL